MKLIAALMLPVIVIAGSCLAAKESSVPSNAHTCGSEVTTLCAARPPHCSAPVCDGMDAVVFVHGIYGSAESFYNSNTHFYWPAAIPDTIDGHPIDVYSLNYQTELLTWAGNKNPQFDQLADDILQMLKPLRVKRYRSVGFIAHSLGGNVVSTYLVKVTDRFGHPQRSQNAYVITLGTPVQGAQVANIAHDLKKFLHMDDDLLASLEGNNLYLRMLGGFSRDISQKGDDHGCRPVRLYAAYEQKSVAGVPIVPAASAEASIHDLVAAPSMQFPVDHIELVKPTGKNDPIYRWAMNNINSEFRRLREWDQAWGPPTDPHYLCRSDLWISNETLSP